MSLPVAQAASQWRVLVAHRGIAFWYFFLASVLLFAPASFFGPTWSYFEHIPHGGFGLGVACFLLGCMMLYGIRRKSRRVIWIALGGGGIAFWVAAGLIAAQGIVGRSGLMESPFMLYVAVDLFMNSAAISWRR